MTLAAVALVVGMPCGSLLLAFRWWLDAKKPSAELLARIESLEASRSRLEMGRIR